MKTPWAFFLLVPCLSLLGCGFAYDGAVKLDSGDATAVDDVPQHALSLGDHSSALSFRFAANQTVPLNRLEKAVVSLPADATGKETFRLDLWIDRGVPNVAVSHAVQKSGGLFRQFAQLRNVALEARVDDKIVWQPKMFPLSERPSLGTKLETATTPSDDPDERLTEMKAIAARFSVPEAVLRVDPVYRYEAFGYGVSDGGTFVFMQGTVRAILAVEATRHAGWQYRVNRFTSPPGSISLDGEEIRSWSGYWASPRSDTDEYVEQKIVNVREGG